MKTEKKHFFHHALLVSSFTAGSRVLGLVRDMACAAVFGGGVVWDAFVFAFRIPNLFRRLFGEGAMSAASMPVLADYFENRARSESVKLVRITATVLSLVLLACLLLGLVFFIGLPIMVDMPEHRRLIFVLSAVLLPYMFFVCLSAFAGAVLHSLRKFSVPAASPLILNGCWIVAVIAVAPRIFENASEQIFVVAVGILIAGVLQLILHLAALKGCGITLLPVIDFHHPAMRKIFINMAPIMLGMAAYQINAVMDGIIALSLAAPGGQASFNFFGISVSYPMQAGANSALYFADRLMQFPLGIFGIALATAIFPVFSTHFAKKNWRGFSFVLTDGLGGAVFIAVPAAAGLMIIGRPAITLLFERHAFTPEMTLRTYRVLMAYSIGLPAYCCRHVLERAFFACNDQLKPVKIASGSIILNIVLNLSLIWILAEAGLALATAISASFQVILLYMCLVRKTTSPIKGRLLKTLLKTLLATIIMAVATLTILNLLPKLVAGSFTLGNILRISIAVLTGFGIYFAMSKALKIPELDIFCEMLKKRE